MTEFTISLAGVAVGVAALYPQTKAFCRDYLTEAAPQCALSISEADIDSEAARSAREDALEGIGPRYFSRPYLETLAVYRKAADLLLEKNAVVFHSAVVAYNGKAYAFTAKSGTGKTTHLNLWLKNIPGAYVLNGDKPLLRWMDGQVMACGTPWQGKENLGRNEMLPLAAICLLERSERNHIDRIGFSEAMGMLLQQTNRSERPELMLQTLDVIGKIGTGVALYRLGCNMDDQAAWVSFRGMTEGT
ncbi:MAG: hypothetical protein IJS55_05785 [Oscillospiraceae bacterium]|nr:hypothetical protein [Oscillospiraceae bacterium]MBR0210766.1 hypothetical protein [Oscillospiraceae bacterium]